MFKSHTPVLHDDFFNRTEELTRLTDLTTRLQAGAPTWLAILGQRKVGKTSLLLEARRRSEEESVVFVTLDLHERLPVSLDIFRTYVLRTLDAFFSAELGTSLEAVAPAKLTSTLLRSSTVLTLPPALREELFDLLGRLDDETAIPQLLDLPEKLAAATERYVVSAWDEFQEVAAIRGRGKALLSTLRSRWQQHQRVAYIISGSEPTMLRELVLDHGSPFFQHFDVMSLGPLPHAEAVELMQTASQGVLPDESIAQLIATVGTHPFYLQVCGEELVRSGAPYDDNAIKDLLQRLMFSRTGRLALYFERVHMDAVGRSARLDATLRAIALEGPLRLTDIAKEIGASSADALRYLDRLADIVRRGDDDTYTLADAPFRLWLAWRSPGGAAVPMSVLGDHAERLVAAHLASMGFDLVYQSRASRGAFDLLATRGPRQIGVQVKRTSLPLVFETEAWWRMHAEAARFNWRWVVCAVVDGEVIYLDPARARVGKTVRVHADAAVDNLLGWADEA